jgi:hypothetical protein
MEKIHVIVKIQSYYPILLYRNKKLLRGGNCLFFCLRMTKNRQRQHKGKPHIQEKFLDAEVSVEDAIIIFRGLNLCGALYLSSTNVIYKSGTILNNLQMQYSITSSRQMHIKIIHQYKNINIHIHVYIYKYIQI